MNAKIKPGYTTKRQHLADVLPLDAPFSIEIAPTQACNFRCNYCTHGKSAEELKNTGFNSVNMDFGLFAKITKDLKAFDGKIKRIFFTGLGEPLVNNQLPDMIKLMKENEIAEKYETFTNASLLTHSMSDRLISAGLTLLKVSIQGLSSRKYKEITGVDIDIKEIIENLKYFYEHKKKCRMYIKIMDVDFDENESEKDFYDMFGNICDEIYVEHIVNMQPRMKDSYNQGVDNSLTTYGDIPNYYNICPYPFYTLQIDAEGNVFPCPPLGFDNTFSFGNVSEQSVYDIWNSKKLNDYKIGMLTYGKSIDKHCKDCENYLCFTPKEENLDDDRDMLIKKFEARYGCQK